MVIKRKTTRKKTTKKVVHEQRGHVLLAPSDAASWMECSGKLALVDSLPKAVVDKGSKAASEGTLAHEYAEKYLTAVVVEGKKLLDAYSVLDGADFEMRKHVLGYANTVMSEVLTKGDALEELNIEKRLEIIEPEAFDIEDNTEGVSGTADVAYKYTKDGKIFGGIIDLKYGRHVVVEAEGNAQLKTYALGVLTEDMIGVWAAIYQPRAEHTDGAYREVYYTADVLKEWRVKLIEKGTAALKILRGDTDTEAIYAPGEKVCRWCDARAICEAYAKSISVEAAVEFTPIEQKLPPVGSLTPEQVSAIVKARSEIEKYLKDVEAYAINAINGGAVIPGLKVVNGRSSRKWNTAEHTEAEIAAVLTGLGVTKIFKTKTTLLGIGDAEKAVGGKKAFRVGVPEGLLTMTEPPLKCVVTEDERTEAVQQAPSEFSVIEDKSGANFLDF